MHPSGVPSHQTARLSAGRHRSPRDGVCVMELASMLAGEKWSDRPRSACPVIAAFLRAYNDSVDDARRQDLVPYAAEVVDTRAPRGVVRVRAELCRRFVQRFELHRPSGFGLCITPRARAELLGMRAGLAAAHNPGPRAPSIALAMVETLIAVPRDAAERIEPYRSTVNPLRSPAVHADRAMPPGPPRSRRQGKV